jgi:aspartyl-tRNA(Asn)/glutamyl-tRNA(Gln) amidotransferase subunit B
MFNTGFDPEKIIEEQGLSQINDEKEIENAVKEVISQNPNVLEDYKAGKQNAMQFFIGQTMAKTKGKANPQIVREILNRELIK